jgi:hypothetical protein
MRSRTISTLRRADGVRTSAEKRQRLLHNARDFLFIYLILLFHIVRFRTIHQVYVYAK